MTNIEHDEIYSSMLVDKSIVYGYFRLIKNKDIDGLLSLFTDDAIVHEPFSNIAGGLQGKAAIKPFLEIAMMANSGYRIVLLFRSLTQTILTLTTIMMTMHKKSIKMMVLITTVTKFPH